MKQRCTNNCLSLFQDRLYGVGIRIHRLSVKGEARCTVCKSTRWTMKMNAICASEMVKPALLPPTKTIRVVNGRVYVG